jgi:hypothetical protein
VSSEIDMLLLDAVVGPTDENAAVQAAAKQPSGQVITVVGVYVQLPLMSQPGVKEVMTLLTQVLGCGVQLPGTHARSGIHKSGIHKSGFHKSGIHKSGIHRSGFHKSGIHKSGIERSGIDKSGMSKSGIDRSGIDRSAIDISAIDRSRGGLKSRARSAPASAGVAASGNPQAVGWPWR